MTSEAKREHQIKSAQRLLHKRKTTLEEIDNLIFLLNQKKQQIINQKLN
jgi:shikimate kinase